MTEVAQRDDAPAPVRWIHGGAVADGLGLAGLQDSADAPDCADGPSAPEDAEPTVFAPIEEFALRALGRRGLSRRELEHRLGRAGYEPEAIAGELDRLESVGLVDDFGLAQRLVGDLQERKRLGRSAIAAELARRMVAPGALEYALDLVEDGDELARARELAEKRARALTGLDPATSKRRLSSYLLRRGFSGSTVRAAVESVRTA